MLKLKILFLLPVLAMFSCFTLYAQEHSHTRTNSDAHVHGIASMTLAIDDGVMEVEFQSPAVNVVGFESKATTDEQISAAEKAKSQLQSPTTLFIVEGSNCEITESEVNFSAILGELDDKDHVDESDHETDHHAHENHDDEHDEEEHNDDHSELSAHYQYKCDKSENITSVEVTLFEQFPTLEEINAAWITEANQGALTLSSDNTIIKLE